MCLTALPLLITKLGVVNPPVIVSPVTWTYLPLNAFSNAAALTEALKVYAPGPSNETEPVKCPPNVIVALLFHFLAEVATPPQESEAANGKLKVVKTPSGVLAFN